MQWIDNINSIITEKKAGNCPFCGSENTDYRMIQIVGELGSADIWCNQCKKAVHLSRIKVSNDLIRKTRIPESLNY